MERDDLQLLHILAFFYWERKQTSRAAAVAYAAYRLGKKDSKLLCLLAVNLLDLGFPDRCLSVLEELDGDDDALGVSIGCIRARALLRLGHLDQARAEFQRKRIAAPVALEV